MKITLIHGENIAGARKRFRKIIDVVKERGWEVISLNLSSNLIDQLRSNSLFNESLLFTLENAGKISSKDFEWLSKNFTTSNQNLLLLHNGTAPKTLISKLPKEAKVESFDVPRELFRMIDSMYPGNVKNFIVLLTKVLKKEPLELVFAMIARQARDLYWSRANEKSMDRESWRIGKLKSQSNKFKVNLLIKLINDLADLDLESKRSQIDLRQSLDFLLVKTLE